MRSRLRLFALALPLLAGCDSPLELSTFPGPVEAARKLWDARGLDDYEFLYVVDCLCALGPDEVLVTVQNDSVTSVRAASTGASRPTADTPTVDGLLTRIADAERSGTYVNALYDRNLGYPVDAVIGNAAVDAAVGYHIRNVRPSD